MESAFWLMLALPAWYFSTIIMPFSAGVLTAVPSLGTVSLIAGSVWGLRKRQTALLWFLVPAAGSHAMVAIAGFMRGSLPEGGHPILLTFVVVEVLAAAYLIFRSRGARAPAALLSIFTVTYALFAAFISAMAFPDAWL